MVQSNTDRRLATKLLQRASAVRRSHGDPYEITGRENLTPAQNTTLDGVTAAHDPTKQRKSVCTADEFISRWTNAEYLALEKKRAADITANKVGNAKNWDIVCAGDIIDLNKQKAQSLKADLVTDGVLTQARADEIFE